MQINEELMKRAKVLASNGISQYTTGEAQEIIRCLVGEIERIQRQYVVVEPIRLELKK